MPTLDEVQRALQRCLEAEPPVDFALSADASQLAAVFAEMRYARSHNVEAPAMKAKQVDAFDRWNT